MPVYEPASIPGPASDYMYHFAPAITVPLTFLEEERVDLKLVVDEDQRWGWPQHIFYGFTLRIYYGDEKEEGSFVVQHQTGPEQTVSLSVDGAVTENIVKVDYFGLYEDVNWQGDGIYYQWQYNLFRTAIRNHIGSSGEKPFTVRWNTAWVPDQDQPVKVRARVEKRSGIFFLTEPVELTLPEREYEVLLIKPYRIPPNWATREQVYTESFRLPVRPEDIEEARLYWRSWSPCYSAGIRLNGILISEEEEWPCYDYYEHVFPLAELSFLKQGENHLTTALTPLKEGKMVHGMEVQWPGIQLKAKVNKREAGPVRIHEITYEGRDHFRIETDDIIWYYDIEGGGFSRMIDRTGSDWISFGMEPWGKYPESAASSFRGLPNLVYGGADDGTGHPGHHQCVSRIQGNSILTESVNGRWKWRWNFRPDHARLTIEKTDPDRNFWFLYEGTPGGIFAPPDYYYGTSGMGPSTDVIDFYRGEARFTSFRWIFAGSLNSQSAFYMIQKNPDQLTDMYGFLGNSDQGVESSDGMTVFGFGRGQETASLLSGPQEFVVGLYDGQITTLEEYNRFACFADLFPWE
jgi:hypothetical protein